MPIPNLFYDPIASTVLPVIAHWTVELRDNGYPAHVLHRSIKSLSSAIITRPLGSNQSPGCNDTAFDLSRCSGFKKNMTSK
jgi:hypothetical protein